MPRLIRPPVNVQRLSQILELLTDVTYWEGDVLMLSGETLEDMRTCLGELETRRSCDKLEGT
jgi:hypothetical protein